MTFGDDPVNSVMVDFMYILKKRGEVFHKLSSINKDEYSLMSTCAIPTYIHTYCATCAVIDCL